jgi:U4/U6 small nuclear ribonucleoprotein PRP4
LRLWRTDDACKRVLTVKAHEDRCTGADFHPTACAAMLGATEGTVDGGPSEAVAMGTACADGVAHLWSVGGKHLRSLKGHADRLARTSPKP